jgi:hypothetical protein
LIVLSCNQGLNNKKDSFSGDSMKVKIHNLPPDSVVYAFLKWYKVNMSLIDTFNIMTDKDDSVHIINGRMNDSSYFYSLNNKGVEKFLNLLKSCDCFSETYLENKRASFKKRGKELDEYKQNDGPPNGFSADEIFLSNESDEIVLELVNEKNIISEINDKKAIVKYTNSLYPTEFVLIKDNDKWFINEVK